MTNYNTEADVETKYIYGVLLKEILKISEDRLSFHVPVKFQSGHQVQTKEADVLVKNKNGDNFIVMDAKAPDQNLESYFGQIDSYAFNLETPISILTNANRLIIRIYQEGNKKSVFLDKTIKELEHEHYKSLISLLKKIENADSSELKKEENKKIIDKPQVINYRRTFRSIHTKIRSIDKLDPSASFDEFSKVLFVKIINDRLDPEEQLTIEKIELLNTNHYQTSFVDKWFQDKVQQYYPGIFMNNERIKLSPKALISVLKILNDEFNVKDSLTDIKGRAFEEFLPSQLRGKGLGQFFTPRPIVDFMVELANISFKDKVLDFASGSGGFLIKAFDDKKKMIQEMPQLVLDSLNKSRNQLMEEAKEQIFGIDAEPRAVRTAKMNMLLWGDGKQIQHGNGLAKKDVDGKPYLAKEYDKNISGSGVDVILANPPFGSTEEDQEILSTYTLSSLQKNKHGEQKYTSEKTENLFVEKAWKLLKPEGKLLIILPEGIFSNSTSKTRDFILSHFTIDSVIRLPKHAFVMSGVDTINTVILIAYKNNEDKQKEIIFSDKKTWISPDHPLNIKFASVNQIGYEPSGKLIGTGYSESDLKILSKKLLQNDLQDITADPKEFAEIEFGDDEKNQNWKKSMLKFINKEFVEVPSRIDPTYHFFYKEAKSILDNFIDIPLTESSIIKEKLSDEQLEENIEEIYKYVSVTKNIRGSVEEVEEKNIDEILSVKSRVQIVKYDDVVFNPYRINTGSVIRINIREKNLVTSPAYIVIRTENINSKYLVQLLKTPFMKYQIQVLASGSVRDNFSSTHLLQLKVPNISLDRQSEITKNIDKRLDNIDKKRSEILVQNNEIVEYLNDF
ncbi:N-6 DNA methylase [Enterococcus sp. AZ126]|uniref:N-6 DNA methylase n=1 Tax=Enterococcus sp. AZ126 TaxID=2774635 RepID=UPI003F20DD38